MTTMIMSITMSLIFTTMKHPLSMGLMLILQTLLVSLMTGMMINTFWFSYILTITMLSGALVLFIYMASIASNEKFNSSIPLSMSTLIVILTAPLLSFFLVDQLEMSKMWSTSNKDTLNNDQTMSLVKLFNIHNMSITILIISYLFFTMIVISYIVNVFEGPLRTKN